MNFLKSILVVGGFALAAVVIVSLYAYRVDIQRSLERASLPEAVEYSEIERPVTVSVLPEASSQPQATEVSAPTTVSSDSGSAALPTEVNLAVPFTAQAPHANWDLPYKEFCEEASALMVVRYLRDQPIASPDDADVALQQVLAFEEERFGYYQDTNAEETAVILRDHFGIDDVVVKDNPTAQDIKMALAAGKPVIVPVAGRMLDNPYFQEPGPLYHMLVIKGYTADGSFITNDPGTRRGADYIYDESTIMEALHDWRTDAQIELGKKVILIVG